MTIIHLMAIFFLLATTLVPSLGAAPPPEFSIQGQRWKPTFKTKLTTGLNMGGFGVQFEKTTLATILEAVGFGEIEHRGDAGESNYWVCYSAIRENKKQRIWIQAHGEMGGSQHLVTRITAQEIDPNEPTLVECPALSVKLEPLSFFPGFWLGNSEEKVLKLLGTPSHQEDLWRSFNFQGKIPGGCPGGFDLMNWLRVKAYKGRLVTIDSGQITSC